MKKRLYFAFFACLFCLFLTAQPTIDGSLAEGIYTTAGTFTSGRDGYGSGNNIGVIKFYTDNTTLYIGITGELNSNNNIVLFMNFSGYGGRGAGNQLDPTNIATSGCFSGSGLDGARLDIDADFAIAFNEGNDVNFLYADGIRYGSGGTAVVSNAFMGTSDQSGTSASFSAASAFGGTGNITMAYINTYSANSTRGIEFSVPISAFPGVTSAQTVEFFALITNSNGEASNETIPGDPGTTNPGFDFDFSAVAGQNFFTSQQMLPVELSYFGVEVKGGSAKLLWTTESELNNNYFEVQQSVNARTWNAIGRVEGRGTNLTAQEYTFVDEKPAAGINYYRLKQVDYDGTFEFSKVVQANLGVQPTNFQCYPNPVETILTMQWKPETGPILLAELFDVTGKMLWRKQVSMDAGKLEMDLQLFPVGMYALRLSDADTGLIVKQLKIMH